MLFSGLCQKRYGTNFPAEGGVRGERWEHIINLATRCILAPHADPCQHTGAGFSLLPPCAAWHPTLVPQQPHWSQFGPGASTEKAGAEHSPSIGGDEAVTLRCRLQKSFIEGGLPVVYFATSFAPLGRLRRLSQEHSPPVSCGSSCCCGFLPYSKHVCWTPSAIKNLKE